MCPGVSIKLILCFFQGMVTAADVIVIPVYIMYAKYLYIIFIHKT